MTSLRWFPGRAVAGHVMPSGIEARARKTARALRRLDDHLLADIGVTREDIDAAARRAAAV